MPKFLQGLLAGIFIVVAFMLGRGCGTHSEGGRTDTVRTIIVHKFDSTIYKIEKHYLTTSKTDTVFIPQKVDTSEVVQDYFRWHVFTDSLVDTNISAKYQADIYKNEVFNPKFSYKLLKPQTTVTVVQREPARVKLFLGATLNTTFGAGGELLLLTKKEQLFSAGYDFVNRRYEAGAAFKISFR